MPRAVHGDEWPCWFGGVSPQAYSAFSSEEAPTCGRGSSLSLFPITPETVMFFLFRPYALHRIYISICKVWGCQGKRLRL